MTDPSDAGDRSDESDTGDGFSLERAYDRTDVAEIFRELTAATESGQPVTLSGDGQAVRVTLPDRVVAGLEATSDSDGDPPVADLTLALEWDDPDGSSIEVVDRDEHESTDAGATDDDGRTSRFEVYEDAAGEWRWRLVHWNGNIIADSGEGYASRFNAERAARGVMRTAPTATIQRRD
ncbi:amphi-Trp domain-containing protein [Haloarchaeobius amylolyticus]|uniref:Amphi-Trp domain-containing protein n=1 Tax=Haloarchaeobius amylolyticus TaxID=1198296 RepID=A0ABD6BL24_9EURY